MREEIESAGNSLSLSGVQRRLLEVEFPTTARSENSVSPEFSDSRFPAKVKETIGATNKTDWRVECDLTEEDLPSDGTGYSISAASPRQRNGTSRVNP